MLTCVILRHNTYVILRHEMPKNLETKPRNYSGFFVENAQCVGKVVFIPKDEVELVKKEGSRKWAKGVAK